MQPHKVFAAVVLLILLVFENGAALAQTQNTVRSVDELFREIGKTVAKPDGPISVGPSGSVVTAKFEPRNLLAAKALEEKYGDSVVTIVGHLLYPEDTVAPGSTKYCRVGQKIRPGKLVRVSAKGATVVSSEDKAITIAVATSEKILRELRTARLLVLNREGTVISTDYGFTDGVAQSFFIEGPNGPKIRPLSVSLSTASCLPGQQQTSLAPGKYRAVAEFYRTAYQPILFSNYFSVVVLPK